MNRKWTSQVLPLGLVLLVLPMPSVAGLENVYVIPRLVAGDIDGNLYTPMLSFNNLSAKQCNGKFQLLEGDFSPAAGAFEFNGVRIRDGILPVSLSPGEGLSGTLQKIDTGGYAGFGIWRQDGACAAGEDVVLTADVEVGKVQTDNEYVIVDQIGFTASDRPSQRWGFAVRKEGPQEAEMPPPSQWHRASPALMAGPLTSSLSPGSGNGPGKALQPGLSQFSSTSFLVRTCRRTLPDM